MTILLQCYNYRFIVFIACFSSVHASSLAFYDKTLFFGTLFIRLLGTRLLGTHLKFTFILNTFLLRVGFLLLHTGHTVTLRNPLLSLERDKGHKQQKIVEFTSVYFL